MKLKSKLLLFWLGSILLSLAVIGGAFAFLANRLHQSTARAQIQEGFVFLDNELQSRRGLLLRQAGLLAAREEVVASSNLIDAYQDLEDYRPLVFDAEKQDLARLLAAQMRATDLHLAALYDSELRLNSFFVHDQQDSPEQIGYVSYREGRPVYFNLTETGPPQESALPRLLQTHPPEELPRQARPVLQATAGGVALEVWVPVLRRLPDQTLRAVGLVRLVECLDARFAGSVARHNKLEFAFWVPEIFRAGGLESVVLASPPAALPLLGEAARDPARAGWLPHREYFLSAARLPLAGGREAVFALALNKHQLLSAYHTISQVALVLLLLAAVGLGPLGAYFLHRMISARIEHLLSGVEALKQGQYITLRGGRAEDELGSLAAAFNSLTHILQEREEHLRKLSLAVEQSPASVVITDAESRIEYVNAKFTEITGYTLAEVRGQTPKLLQSSHTPAETYQALWQALANGQEWRGEFCNRRKNGELFWEAALLSPIKAPDGTITHYLGVKEDITARKAYEERLLHQANFDALTGLPNRVLALDRLEQALAFAHRNPCQVAVMFVDLDHFKKVNDTLGHAHGDRLLVEVARRLLACVREGDTLARLGGDEFLVILPDLKTAGYAEVVAQRLLSVFLEPVPLGDREIFVSASIGLSLHPADGADPQVLLRNADAAMYRAKEAGRNAYRFFTPEMNRQALKRLEMESHLRRALERGELSLHYQPQVAIADGRLVGAEALLRWRNPELGDVSPEQFVPLAEASGLIPVIGTWVLRGACRQARAWREQSGHWLHMAVNVSSCQFRNADFCESVAQILEETGVPAACLELELTESLLMDNTLEIHAALSALKDLGLRLALDDFGTGYSSLSYLKRFPFDLLKIDRSFVRDVTTDPEDASLSTAIIMMAHSLGLKVIAEGVETGEQLAFLRFQGCDLVQGYYFSRPLPGPEFAKLLYDQNGALPLAGATLD